MSISRRQLLLGGGALMGAGLVPGVRLVNRAFGDEIPRPDYMIRVGTNENPWGPSRVAIQAINRSLHRSSTYGVNSRKLTSARDRIEIAQREYRYSMKPFRAAKY